MAIKISGTTVIDDTRNLTSINTTATGNVTVTGFANVSTTLAAGNTSITGFVNASTNVTSNTIYATNSFNVGTSFTANSTVVNAVSYNVGATQFANTTGVYATFVNGKTEGNLNVNNALTANNSTNLGGVAAANYARVDAADDFNALVTFNANAVFTKSISANASYGSAGQVLTSGGTGNTYWATPTVGDITSVTAGDGLTGGGTSGDVTLNVGAANGITVAADTVAVAQGTGVVVNASGVHVNAAYIGTIAPTLTGTGASGTWGISISGTAANATLLNNKSEGNLNVNSASYANASVTNTFTVGTGSYFVSNGNVGIGNSAPTTKLSVNGNTFFGNGISFGSSIAASTTNLSSHIALWSTTYGFNVTDFSLNYTVPSNGNHIFNSDGTETMKSNLTGFYVGGRFLANSSHANATHLSGKTEGNLNVNNATTAYSKTEGNLNVNNALTANNSTNLGGIAASSYYRSGSTDVALADGGTNASLTASAGAIAFSNATGIALTAVGTSGQVLTSAAAGTPTWTSQSSLAAGTATTATNQSGGTVAATTGSFTGRVIGTGALASGTMLTATGALGAFEAQTVSGANAAFMSFHRAGLYASYFGLDTDNQFAVGGWSAGAALANMKVGSLGVGGAASGTAGSITATGSISAASLAGSIATGNGASGTWNITANNATNLGGTAAANYDKFPSGTRLVFHQTAAPTGWTKDTTHDNKALRVVSGTVGSGGTVAFTTAFASQSVTGTVGNYTLLTNDIPSHTHFIAADIVSGGTAVANATAQVARSRDISTNSPNYILNSTTTAATVGLSSASGGGTAHNHSFTGTAINMAVQYVDIILAQKN